jgi:methylated-DNA-[protein]-cysteine S-methyltransferase
MQQPDLRPRREVQAPPLSPQDREPRGDAGAVCGFGLRRGASGGLLIDRLPTPIGTLVIVTDRDGQLRAADWSDQEARMRRLLARCGHDPALEPARDPGGCASAVDAYFRGELAMIDSLAVEAGGTPFQRAVWQALRAIPAGQTMSYAELARHISCPSAVRAVGHANGANPISVVVPCHRLIGTDGSLTGYGGGLERKRWLLAHEAAAVRRPAAA